MGIVNNRDVSFFKNGQPLFVNPNTYIKNNLQPNDQITTVNGQQNMVNQPYRQPANTTPTLPQNLQNQSNPQFNQQFNPQIRATNIVTNQEQTQFKNGMLFGINPQFGQQQNFSQIIQPSQFTNPKPQQQVFQQTIPQSQTISPNINLLGQKAPQIYKQDDDIFASQNQQQNHQEEVDIFATEFQFSNYDEQRLNYLKNKNISPGDKQLKFERDNYIFTIDNFGDELIIQKNDQSFYLKLNSSFQMKQKRQIDIQSKDFGMDSTLGYIGCVIQQRQQNIFEIIYGMISKFKIIINQLYLKNFKSIIYNKNEYLQKNASLILVRDDYKVLVLERSKEISFGGSYVFPGGILEEVDDKIAQFDSQLIEQNHQKYYCHQTQGWYDSFLIAAIRETIEETNIQLDYKQLYQKIKPFLRIITPQMIQKRYDAQFFFNLNNYDTLDINKIESTSYEWNTPIGFLEKFIKNQIQFQSPIFLQLLILQQLGSYQNIVNYIDSGDQYKHTYPHVFQFSNKYVFNYPDQNYNLQELMETEQTDYLKSEFSVKYNHIERSDFRFELEGNQKKLTGHIGKFMNSPLALLYGQIINDSQFMRLNIKEINQ
ncbi:unnamed protein product [Paramecium pentaurelia]|uniref:Nudix hydrolase domain-containing protein n=1 Tax=Paramecium pentaurelia TaxID=43138 RepID=A0A8S1THF6_9CILI|nr:unnamed protein product [Paramecium pentaurelia]